MHFVHYSILDENFFFFSRFCTYKEEAKCGPLKPSIKEEVVIEVDPCDPFECQLPYCYCSDEGIFSPLDTPDLESHPQMIMLMFDGAVNFNNFLQYDSLLQTKHYKSKDSCPLRGTFFVKNEYNNYALVQELYYRSNFFLFNSQKTQLYSAVIIGAMKLLSIR